MSEFREKSKLLEEQSFTDALKANELLLDVDFDELEIDHSYENYYTNGEILNIPVELNEKNREILSNYIQDFDAYNALVEHEYFKCADDTTDLVALVYYVENKFGDTLKFDWTNNYFYYDHNECT